jgi:hypothetical protein
MWTVVSELCAFAECVDIVVEVGARTFHGPLEEHLAAAAGDHAIVAARGLV